MAAIKIPVWIAILININIVIGAGFLVSTGKIAAINGVFSPLAWVACGLLLLPLVIALADLAVRFPAAGGIYIYSEQCLGSLWGFVSGWGYYVGTVAANAAVIHAFSVEVQKIESVSSWLQNCGLGGFGFDALMVLLFAIVNLFNIEFLERAQITFTLLKSIPLLLVVVAVPMLFNASHFIVPTGAVASNMVGNIIGSIPLVLFAFIGIEACCAVIDKIENGKQNAARVLLLSFAIIVAIYALLQFFLFCIHGSSDVNPFLSILPQLTSNQMVIDWGNAAINIAILSSFLGGFYGMFYYNNWNLYAMGKERSIMGWRYLTMLSRNQTPWVCVMIQSLLVLLLIATAGHGYYLVAMADFGTSIAYLLSALAFVVLARSIVGFLAIASCSVFIYFCATNLLDAGLHYALPFLIILGGGIVAHKINTFLE